MTLKAENWFGGSIEKVRFPVSEHLEKQGQRGGGWR